MQRILLIAVLAMAVASCAKESFTPSDQAVITTVDPNQPTELTVTVQAVQATSHTGGCESSTETGVPDAEVRIYSGTTASGTPLAVMTTDRYGRIWYDDAGKYATHFVSTTFPDGTVVQRSVSTPAHRHTYVTLSY